ncbi:5-oxoprolinase subunit C family protein [Clostridium brassicae]|uniref:Biotin-dependent carboxyltransferase family protein n=1 Tax=Clostridium brassicae TaxID=2999072 RepID=A0ABT4D9U3_9CLOT|nr:biotin-dependent carboxyltransferase family protein [Clostridium brassicae]MCY6959069.1 biotin-dependent carboxyltransferase family protein [Clostridium brassicae]
MGIEVISPGLLTTIQDLGRYGFRKYGVIVSGAMDSFAHRVANILVGNEEGEATLEITLLGPKILMNEDTLISICGADLSPKINDVFMPMWRPVYVKKGSVLSFGKNNYGARAYLAFAGSFNIEGVMGSKSTYLRAEIGGYEGRQIKKGDILSLKDCSEIGKKIIYTLSLNVNDDGFSYPKWFVSSKIIPNYINNFNVRVVKGGEFDYFCEDSKKALFKNSYLITPQSDRMGYRLKGENLQLEEPLEMISEAVALGTIQVPADGNPIILLADRQTTGGYPKIGQVSSIDIPIVSQMKPGDRISFSKITLKEAQELYIQREKDIQDLRRGLNLKIM